MFSLAYNIYEMAPKRFKKSDVNEENGEKYKNLVISDVLCPICRSIFIEPVTLPCSHGFCLTCFNSTMENTTLTCPLCRIRIGSWLRSARKEKKIINDVLWQIIQLKFSKEIRKKLEGDDITSAEETIPIKLANPGEIRKEYEIQLQRERSELQKRHETESKASEIVIKKILEEEQNAAKIEEEKLRLDEEMARRIAAESTISSSSSQFPSTPKSSKKSSIDRYLIALSKKKQEPDTNKPKTECAKSELSTPNKSTAKEYNSTIICQSRIKQQCSKAYQHLLLTKTLQYERAESNGSDSGDSIKQEMRYFKPIRVAPSEKFHGDKNYKSQLIKIPTVHATSKSSVVIRSPQNSLVRIQAHPGSAFVSCSPEPNSTSTCILPVKQPSIISESGKIIKQYYNKKRNTLCNKLQSCSVSPEIFPCLGFVIENEFKYVTIMRDLVSTMSEHVNRCLARSTDNKNVLKEVPRQNLTLSKSCDISKNKKNLKTSPKKLNGFDTSVASVAIDINLQEQLDLEFARRLHEELNNPRNRQTRASNQPKKPDIKTRSSSRKRQVTLDELIPSKKFKI